MQFITHFIYVRRTVVNLDCMPYCPIVARVSHGGARTIGA